MLVKTDKIDKKGRRIYRNVLTGEEGTIGHVLVYPSERRSRRHPVSLTDKIHSNRKATRGRRMYFQTVVDKEGKKKTFKHYQYTSAAVERKMAVVSLFDRIRALVTKKAS